jgi:hypothetical protein
MQPVGIKFVCNVIIRHMYNNKKIFRIWSHFLPQAKKNMGGGRYLFVRVLGLYNRATMITLRKKFGNVLDCTSKQTWKCLHSVCN